MLLCKDGLMSRTIDSFGSRTLVDGFGSITLVDGFGSITSVDGFGSITLVDGFGSINLIDEFSSINLVDDFGCRTTTSLVDGLVCTTVGALTVVIGTLTTGVEGCGFILVCLSVLLNCVISRRLEVVTRGIIVVGGTYESVDICGTVGCTLDDEPTTTTTGGTGFVGGFGSGNGNVGSRSDRNEERTTRIILPSNLM